MKSSFGHLLAFRQLATDAQNNTVGGPDGTGDVEGGTKDLRSATSPEEIRNMTSEEAGTWILQHTPSTFQVSARSSYLLSFHLVAVLGALSGRAELIMRDRYQPVLVPG